MTWTPTPQPPCPCPQCNGSSAVFPKWTPVERVEESRESDWQRQASWPDVEALPPTDHELRQHIEDTDLSPVAEPPEPKGAAGTVHTQVHVPSQVDSIKVRVEGGGGPGHVNLIRRILNATVRKD